ncbi:hypothetical protein [Pseudoglutamicibacter cumminsii]|uniref:hypothetical protein n=1 Tax=Pseudoglutamicibacter cumminsii TaxID=156979 RepID=UPI0021A4A228|nr:hypothetical protein [Pseudoglutamicibacter cumminsii]MCT1686293.1 hypothetical protein [Pseudoglutamicibacter cumminsii]
MAETLTTLRDRVIPRIMWAQAILYLAIGATWYTAPTESRLRGLGILGGDRPHIAVALLLTVGGVITIAGAIAPAPRYGWVRILGVCVASATPLLVAYPYLLSWLVGDAPRGHITAISYTGYSVIFIAAVTAVSRYTIDSADQIRAAPAARHATDEGGGGGVSE